MRELTPRQKEVLSFVYQFQQENGFSACYRDVASHFGFSAKAAFDHLKALERKGALTTRDSISRSFRVVQDDLVDDSAFVVGVPILGSVAAGRPLISEENKDGEVSVCASLLGDRNGRYFAMRVKGDSMVELGILDGDLAILIQQETAQDGDIVMAACGSWNDITLKRFYRHPTNIELRPANERLSSIFTADCQILGRLVLSLRTY